jgi:signal transduction histidine kinase/ligand-binding sensor domain-containing protein
MPRLLAHLMSLWILLAPWPAWAQREHPAFRRFGLTQGLPQSQVSALLEDHHGFIWVATITGGVARLGASGFKVFGAPEGLQVRSVASLAEDGAGHIWVAGRDGGISEIAGERVINHGPQTGIPEPRVYALAMDRHQHLLVGTGHGLYRREGDRFTPVALPEPWSKLPIFKIAVDGQDAVWVMTRGGRLACWNGAQMTEEQLPSLPKGTELMDLQVDPQGRIWALTEEKVYLRHPEGWKPEALPGFPPHPKAVSLAFSQDGSPIVALGSDGLWLKEDGRPRLYGAEDGIPKDLITVVMRDHHGGLWVGSDGDGLAARLVQGLWTVGSGEITTHSELGAVMSIEELGNRQFLFATNHGLALFEEGKGVIQRWSKAQGLSTDSLWCTLRATPSGVWIGTDRGMQLWRAGKLLPGPKDLEQTAVTHLIRHQGLIYAATEKGVAVMTEAGALLRMVTVPPELGPRSVSQLLPRGQDLIVGGLAGVMVMRSDKLSPISPTELSHVMAAAFLEDHQGELWVASTAGLVHVKGAQLTRVGTRDGLLDENFTWAFELDNHVLVGAHGKGVSFLSSSGIQHLTRNLGLLSDETNQNGFLLDRNGRLWIGMMGGVNRLDDPKAFRNVPMQPPVVVEARWPGGSVTLPTRLDLPPLPEVLELRFDLGQPGLPITPRYQALLEGVDSDWRDVSQGNALQYLHLGKGARSFRLRATIDGLRWVETQPLFIDVRPAWHERVIVRILFALALAGIVAAGIRWRLHRLALAAEQLEAMVEDRTHMLDRQYEALAQAHEQIKRSFEARIRLVDMVTHDLRSPLTSITLAVDRLRDEEGLDDPTALLTLLERESQRIDDLLRTLLESSRSEATLQSLRPLPTTPWEVLEGIQEVLRLKVESKGLQFHLDLPGDQTRAKVLVDPTALRQAILNLVENAVKFTPAGGQVGLRSRLDLVTLEWVLGVWDTGRGIPKQVQAEIMEPFAQANQGDAGQGWGLGLSIVRNLVEAHGGTLSLESEEGKGATFFIALPLLEH